MAVSTQTCCTRLRQLRIIMLKRSTNLGYTASCPRGALDVRVRHVDMSRPIADPGVGKGLISAPAAGGNFFMLYMDMYQY